VSAEEAANTLPLTFLINHKTYTTIVNYHLFNISQAGLKKMTEMIPLIQ